MAEIATLARPYAEALVKVADQGDGQALLAQVQALAQVAAEPALRQFADDPRSTHEQVLELFSAALKAPLGDKAQNFLRTVLANDRLAALPEIAAQFHALMQARSGVSQAVVYSAFALDAAQLAELAPVLEQRFGRKLELQVQVVPELIGGIRVAVGDEVLDTSVKARLENMKMALTA
jgi:F-type H+-transporting ATPase subunit delta